MDLIQICDFVGGSLLADDYRGDFKQIAAAIKQSATTHTQKPLLNPNAVLCEAAYWILSGNHYKARVALKSLEQGIGATNERWRSRIKSYELFSFVSQLHPPPIRFRSRFGGSTSTIFEAQNNLLVSELRTNRQQHATLDQFEASLPLCIYQYNTYLGAKQCQHALYTRTELALASIGMLKALGSGFPPGYVQSAADLHLAMMSSSLQRLEYEVETAPLLGLSQSRLGEISTIFEHAEDLVGEASCLLSAGDKSVSPPFTNPLALNLMVEGKLMGMVDDVWDLEEPKFRLSTNSNAESYYDRAFQLMEAAGCRRGCAAVKLRQAAVLHMTAFCPGYESSRAAHLSKAKSIIIEALEYFAGDEANTCLANTHKVLLEISDSHISPASKSSSSTVMAKAAEIGAWGRAAENTMLSQFCGLLMLRFGRRMLLDHSYLDVALLAVACAKAVFQGSHDEYWYLQALLAEADVLYNSGDFSEAELTIREAIKRLGGALQALCDLGNTSAEVKRSLRRPIANFLLFFDQTATKILAMAADSNVLDEWREKSARLEIEVSMINVFYPDHHDPADDYNEPDSSQASLSGVEYEKRENLRLGQAYNSAYAAAYAELEKGSIDGFDVRLAAFLATTSSMRASKDQIATFRIMANSSLGLTSVAAAELPFAVPTYFGLPETSDINRLFRQMTFQGIPMGLGPQIDRTQAQTAISLCFLSQDWKSGMHILQEANHRIRGYLVLKNSLVRGYDWKLDFWIGAIYEHNNLNEDALKWYLRAQQLLESFRSRTADAAARAGSGSSIHTSELFSGLVRIALSFATRPGITHDPKAWNLPSNSWIEQSLVFAEQSMARTLLELLLDKEEVADATGAKPDVLRDRAQYLYLKRQITDLDVLPPKAKADREAELTELKRRLKEFEGKQGSTAQVPAPIQALTEALSYSTSISKLCGAIPEDAVAININQSRSGLILFCITRSGIQRVHQSSTSSIRLRRQTLQYVAEIDHYREALENEESHGLASHVLSTEELKHRVARISDEIIAPFADVIETKEHVIFLPTQELNVFPLSALMHKEQPLFLTKAVSQAPSLSVFEQLASRPPARLQKVHTAIYETHEPPAPREPKPGDGFVPMVGVTALLTSHLFDSTPIHAASIREPDFQNIYSASDLLLISTHGFRSPYSPWQSYIKLASDFRVMELSKFRTNASLVVFGACLSAAGRVTASSDVLGFSHAVLQSGARAYLGSLWEVDDVATMLLMLSFFREVASREPGVSLAKCWAHAQRAIYALDSQGVAQMLSEIREEVVSLKRQGVGMASLGRLGMEALEEKIDDFENNDGWLTIDFKHPYYWGAFVLVGFGGLFLVPTQLSG